MTTSPPPPALVGSGSFWARQARKDKIAIVAFAVELMISLGLLLIGVLADPAKLSLTARFALITGNMVALVVTLQFAVSRFFDDQKEHIDTLSRDMEDVKGRIAR